MEYQHLFTLGFKVNDGTATDWRYRTVTIDSIHEVPLRSEFELAKQAIRDQFDRQKKYEVSFLLSNTSTLVKD